MFRFLPGTASIALKVNAFSTFSRPDTVSSSFADVSRLYKYSCYYILFFVQQNLPVYAYKNVSASQV